MPGSWASAPSGRAPGRRRSSRRCPRAPLLRFTCASAFLRLSRSTIASIDGPTGRRAFDVGSRRAGFGPFGGGACGLHPLAPVPQGQLDLSFLPHGPREIAALLAIPPFGPSADRSRLLCPLLTSAPRSGRLAARSVPIAGTRRRPPEVRSTAFAARPPDLPPRSLMAVDFAIICSLVRPGRPRYPVLVHRAAALLHASFRPPPRDDALALR